jgi:hypothetical protein
MDSLTDVTNLVINGITSSVGYGVLAFPKLTNAATSVSIQVILVAAITPLCTILHV